MRAATMTRAGAVELEDSAETLRDAPRRRRRRSRDGKPAQEETSAANDGDGAVATLSWCESACATVVGALAVRVRKGEMSPRTMSLCVLAMWATSLAYKALFIGLRMDKNTPPPDRVALLAIKLFFSLMRWALGAALGAPVWTLKAFYSGVTRRAVDRGWDDDLVANEGPRDLADDVRDRVTNKDYEAFATAVANDEGDWDVIASGRVGCCTYRMLRGVSAEDKRMMKKGLAKFRTEVLAAGVPAEILFHAQTDLLGRQAWDSTTLHPTCVEREDAENKEKEFTAQDVVYWRLKYPRLMAPRDYLVSRRMWYDKKNEMATCICRDALESPSAVSAKNKLQQMMGARAVDVKSMYSAIMVGKNDEVKGSQYVSIYYEDPGVPPRLAHMAAAKGLDAYMATFNSELQRRVRANARMKNYDAIPAPPATREVPHTRSFRTGRTSVPQSDDEGEDATAGSRAGSPPLDAEDAANKLHFAPTDSSREYLFSGRNGLNKRQRVRRRIGKVLKLLVELVDPNSASAASRRAAESSDDESFDERTAERPQGRKRKWARRIAFGALVWIGKFTDG